jgi:cysteine desulfurase/selenocysteine lyase
MNNLDNIRNDFPILSKKVNGKSLVYFDNGATTQKPNSVIQVISDYYKDYNSNVHRGVHQLSQLATEKYENARIVLKQFINASYKEEVIFTKGTTEAINIVASSYGRKSLSKGDEVIISAMEHHSNIVPWQMICEEKGAKLIIAPINNDGDLIMDQLFDLINSNTKIISLTHVSNTLGTINPIQEIIDTAHSYNAVVLIDAAQSIQHLPIDVQQLNCDFLAFSGHKMYGPTGVGVLFGKKRILEEMGPIQGGGDMIKEVTFNKTTYNDLPYKFEAGTPNIVGVIGLAEAIKYIQKTGFDFIQKQESALLMKATHSLSEIDGLRIIGNAKQKSSVISFVVDGVHPFDIGTLLDQLGIAIRTGHHCTQPLMDYFKIPGTARASFSFYNSEDEVGLMVEGLKKAVKMLA